MKSELQLLEEMKAIQSKLSARDLWEKIGERNGWTYPRKRGWGVAIVERILSRVKVDSKRGCWNWIGSTKGHGYASMGITYAPKVFKAEAVSRISYLEFIGPIPKGLHALHTCDNPKCVNPFHIFLGTNLQNVRDKIFKGRSAVTSGEKNGRRKLSNPQVIKMRELYRMKSKTHRELAVLFGVSQAVAYRIVKGQSWKHI